MSQDFWLKQTSAKPLFPELEWSRPENRRHAGKLLIVGGNGYEFKAPANAYGDALAAGIGTAKVLLPSSMQKTVASIFPEAEFAPSTISGSLARSSLGQLLELADWADGVLLAGDIGHNSETSVLIESFTEKYKGLLTIARDVKLAPRPEALFILSQSSLQQLATELHSSRAITSKLSLLQIVEVLRGLCEQNNIRLITSYGEHLVVVSDGQVSTTQFDQMPELETIAAHASVWWLQNSTRAFEALTTAVYDLAKPH